MNQRRAATLMILLFGFSLGVSGQDRASSLSGSAFRIMSVNLRHGAGPGEIDNLDSVAQLIQELKPDLVAIQEVDQGVRRSGGRDQPGDLASMTGMYAAFSATLDQYQGGKYGLLLLSRFPFSRVDVHELPYVPGREPRIIQEAALQTDAGLSVVVYHTHFGYDDPETVTQERIASLQDLYDAHDYDVLFVIGDLNFGESAPEHESLENLYVDVAGSSAMPTYPSNDPRIQLDHIFYRTTLSSRVTGFDVVSRPAISDHLPVWAEITFWNQ